MKFFFILLIIIPVCLSAFMTKDCELIIKASDGNKSIFTAPGKIEEAKSNSAGNRIALYCRSVNCPEKFELFIIDFTGNILNKFCIPQYGNFIGIEDLRWFDSYYLGYSVRVRPDFNVVERVEIYSKNKIEMYNGTHYTWSENYKYVAFKVWIPPAAPEEYKSDFLKVNETLVYPDKLEFIVKHNFLSAFYWVHDQTLFFLDYSENQKRLVYYKPQTRKLLWYVLAPEAAGLQYNNSQLFISILDNNKNEISRLDTAKLQ
ncbi:MAG: hypothetical protein A2096_05700 [Spirochaetes bacterium GWF1_41_5]|nr:MAG: hypothetical protein A2096_05700 [Spirochaetes bacterium GWF1_41_5]HBE01577.1 hypothetical protein [Spirochaetia bacterium]